MFYYEYPEFEKKHLLKIEMLEQLRDYPRDYTRLLMQGKGNGIVSGCEITWSANQLIIAPGIIYWNKNLYFMREPYMIECLPEDRLRYLKVKFLVEKNENGKICGGTSIYLNNESLDVSCEIELCRFRLQEGAKLRSIYKNFGDYSTEYDTINIIHAPYSDNGNGTISPRILMRFAHEMLNERLEDMYDVSFCMNVLAANGQGMGACVREYLQVRMGRDFVIKENIEVYNNLLKILKSNFRNTYGTDENNQNKKGIMLL